MAIVSENTKKVLFKELPKCPYFVDNQPGRWVKNASGTIFFDDSLFSSHENPTMSPTYFLPDGRIYYG
jgi:hypothetical protein